MGGFRPSRGDIAGSTVVGSDKDVDSHQFTGSVDITGSLTLNGSAITGGGGGGGGGAVSTYTNAGDNRVITSVNSSTINGEASFTFDGSDMVVSDDTDAKANIGRAVIGYDGTNSDYAIFAHRDNATNANFALQQRANGTTVVNAKSGQSLSLRMGNANALVVAGASNNNVGINTGTPLARLHVSASSVESDVLRVDGVGTNTNSLYVSGSGRVGIGTGTPESTLEVRSTTTQQKWSYDDDHEFTITVADDGETVLAVSGTTVSPSPASDLVFDVSRGGDIFFRRSGDRLRLGISTGTTFLQTDNQDTDMSFRVHPNGGLGAVGTEVFRVDASGAGALLVSGTISNPGGDAPINFRDTATSIHSPASNRLAITAPLLEVTGTLHLSSSTDGDTVFKVDAVNQNAQGFAIVDSGGAAYATINKTAQTTYPLDVGGNIRANQHISSVDGTGYGFKIGADIHHIYSDGGTLTLDVKQNNDVVIMTGSSGEGSLQIGGTFGATTTETLTSAGALSANTATSIINVAGQTANVTYAFTIGNGTFVGQEKKIYGMALSASSGPASNNIMISGTNIRSNGTTGFLNISGSDQEFGGGTQWVFQSPQAGASLVWDGSKWLIVGNNAFDITYT